MLPFGEVLLKQTYKLSSQRRFSQLTVLMAAGCLTTMTGGVVSPVLPEIVQQLHLDPKWAGMLVSTHALAIALFTPILGILADRVGKLRVMIPSLILYAVFGTAGAFIPNLGPLLISRALLGVASGGIAAAAIGFLGTLYEGEERSRVLGYATSAMTTASILIPLVGGWVGSTHWQYAFYLYGLGLPLAVIAALLLQEDRLNQSSVIVMGQHEQLTKVLLQPSVLKLYFTVAMAAMIVYAVVIYTPLYLKATIGAGPELNGFVLAVRGVGAATVSAVLASRIAKRLGENRAIALGFLIMSVTLGTIPFLHQLQWIVPTAVLFGAGFGILTPNLYNALANLSPPEMRASVLAIGTGFNSLGQFVSPILLGPIWKDAGLSVVFYITASIALAAGILSLLQRKEV